MPQPSSHRFALASSFLQAVRSQPLLSRDEEIDLARRSRGGDEAASARLVAAHLRFVLRIARRYRKTGLPMADLVQEGVVGLLHAVRKFNPDRDVRLATYAMWWIRASIQEHVVRSWSIVRVSTTAAQKALFLNLRRLGADLREGADAIGEEMAERLSRRFDIPVREVRAMARRVSHGDLSLNVPLGERDREDWIDRMECDRPSPEETVAAASGGRFWHDLLGRALDSLSPRERLIIQKRHLDEAGASFAAIARELGLSKERVRQLEAAALEKLRQALVPARREEGLPPA